MSRNQLPTPHHSTVHLHPRTPKDHSRTLVYPDSYAHSEHNPGAWGPLASPPPSPSPWDRYLKEAHDANVEPGPSTHANALPRQPASLLFANSPGQQSRVYIPPSQPGHHDRIVLPSPVQEYVKGTVDPRHPPPDAWMKTPIVKYEPLYRKAYQRSGKPDVS